MDKNSSNNNALPKSLKDSPLILKGQNVPIVSADLAPVHYSGSKQLKIHRMETENKIANRPIAPGSSDIASSSGNLAITMKEKLSLNPKSVKNVGKNGMRLGTTDVEVHCGTSLNFGLPSNDVNKVVQENLSVTDFSSICLPNCQQQYSCMSSQEKISNSQLSTSKPISSTCTNYHVNSVLWKPEINFTSNGAICNGHTISEATSSNSIAVSDFSLSSDKSTSLDSSYSCSGARPRKRNASSNSSSQSIQPHSECEVGLSLDISSTNTTSDLCKVGLGQQDGKLKSPLGLLDYSLTNVTYDDSKPTMPNLNVNYVNYENENQMEAIMKLIQKDLSEPYSIYTYRYFIHNWPKLCFLAMYNNEVIGAIVCKLDVHKKVTVRGYIAMLAVDQKYRKKRIGSNLVQRAIREMTSDDADEVVLETEITNKPALQLYENLGFVRDKRLFRYYLNGVDALRLKLWLR